MYLVNARPDICFVVSTLSQYLVESKAVPVGGSESWYSWILFVSGDEVRLQRYTNYDRAGSAVDRLSTPGCCFSLELVTIYGVSWKQASVALSTAETEYVTANITSREVVKLQKLLPGLHSRHGTKGSSEAPVLIHG
jgi:hypothetical protein